MKSFIFHATPAGSRLLVGAATFGLLSSLAGCGVGGNFNQALNPSAALTTAQGRVHGGNQPVVGSNIQLYYAGAPATGSGYGLGATTLIGSPVTTDANGAFSITGKYVCPTPAAQLYIVATGGNPGLGSSVNNNNLAMMTALGTCPAGGNLLASIPNISINEVTTVAAVFALQNFMAAPATANNLTPSIGAPTTSYTAAAGSLAVKSAVVGMNNAFTTAKVLADITTGLSPNTNYSYATPDSAKINTIADILSYCINSDPSQSSNCSTLMSAVTPSGSKLAVDTIQATWYMAQNPINNISALYALVDATPPFVALGTAPKDWTVAITYTPTTAGVATVNGGYGLAIDAYGNAWVANGAAGGAAANSVVELGVDGSTVMQPVTAFTASLTGGSAPQFTTPPAAARTISGPKYPAIDLNNNVWVTNYEAASGITAAGTPTTGSLATFTGSAASAAAGTGGGSVKGGFFVGSFPYSVAIDGSNNVIVANSGSTSTNLDYASVAKMANDGSGYIYSTSGSTAAPNRLIGGSAGSLALVVLDNNPNVTGGITWVLNAQGCAVVGKYGTASTKWGTINQFASSTLAPTSGSNVVSSFSNQTVGAGAAGGNCGSTSNFVGQLTAGGMATPSGIVVDRLNNIWVQSQITSSTGFDGVSYFLAPTANTGIIPTSYTVLDSNATPPASGVTPIVSGTTLRKGSVLAVDGNNNLWAASQTLGAVAELSINPATGATTFYTPGQNGTSSPTTNTGFVHNISFSNGLAIDPSGNVWVTSNGAGTYTNAAGVAAQPDANTVTVIVGAAAPVITPMALALANNKIGQKP